MPAFSYMKFLWDTLQEEAAPDLTAIRLPPPLDLIALRLAGNFRHATLALLPDVPDGSQGNRINATWMQKERRLFLTRLTILAFLAFLSDLPPPAIPEPAGPSWRGQPEDKWIAQTMRSYDCSVPGQWQRINPQVHLRTLGQGGGLSSGDLPMRIKVSYSRKDCLWHLHILRSDPGTAQVLSQPSWLTIYNRGLYTTAAFAIEATEQALLLHSLKRAMPEGGTPQDHRDAVWITRSGKRAVHQGTWTLGCA